MSAPEQPEQARIVVDTFQTKKAAHEACWQLRRQYPHSKFDVLSVWLANPPIRTTNPFAVVEYRSV